MGRARAFRLAEHYRQHIGGLDRPADEATARYWVLSRGLVRTRVLPLAQVPTAKRAAAIDLALTAWQPYAHSRHYVLPQAQSALLFAWDGERVDEAMRDAAVDGERVQVVPENALHTPPSPADADGGRLLLTLDGVEARHARSGNIVASRWWPAVPDAHDWLNHVRTLTDDPAVPPREMPAPQTVSWIDAPRGYAAGERDSDTLRSEWAWLAVAAWLLALPTLWYLNQWQQLSAAQTAAEERTAAIDRELGGALTARDQALNAVQRAERLRSLYAGNDMLRLMVQIHEVLGGFSKPGSLQIADWDYRDRRLKFTLLAPNGGVPATTVLVKAFENVPGYRDVQALADGNRIAVELSVAAEAADAPSAPNTPAGTKGGT